MSGTFWCRACLVAATAAGFILGMQIRAVAQQGDQSLQGSLQSLEFATDLKGNSQLAMLERVEALEKKVFGATRAGTLMERIAQLQAVISRAGQARPLQGAADGAGQAWPPRGATNEAGQASPVQDALAPPPLYGTATRARQAPSISGAVPPGQFQPGQLSQPVNEPEGSSLRTLLPLQNVSPPHFLRIAPPGRIAGDYFPEVMKATKGKIFRFKTMPIPVFITPFPEKAFTESCIKGFENWEVQTDGSVRFVQVGDPSQARIRVIWNRLGLAKDNKGCTLGAHTITKWRMKPPGTLSVLSVGMVPVPIYIPKLGPKYSVAPQIIEVNLDLIMSKNLQVRYPTLQNIVTHELGHALGLLGHSPSKTDMMFPVTDEHSRLSPRDIKTLIRIYEEKVDIPL